MSQKLHVTNIKLPRIVPKTPWIIYFWKGLANSSLKVMQKMSQMLHDTKINLLRKSPVIYFEKLMQNPVQMSCKKNHVTCVTCHKYYVANNFTKDPMCYIFLESSCKIQFNGHAKKSHVTCVTCHMSQMLHVTNIKLPRILPKTPCVIYFWKALAKSSSMVMQKHCMSHVLF